MFYGILAGQSVVLTDRASGKPVVGSEPPEPPEGYVARDRWVDGPDCVAQVWDLEPAEGTAEEASLMLARMQFASLPDEAAYACHALADEYVDGMTCYGEGNDAGMPVTRVRYLGELYRFIGKGTQVMQPGWNPVEAPSLWARILPGQEGSGDEGPQPWEQPGSTNGYQKGDQVTHDGHLWESTYDGDNVWEPGAVGAPWEDKGPWPQDDGEAAGKE